LPQSPPLLPTALGLLKTETKKNLLLFIYFKKLTIFVYLVNVYVGENNPVRLPNIGLLPSEPPEA
jgi:hypothetical protein